MILARCLICATVALTTSARHYASFISIKLPAPLASFSPNYVSRRKARRPLGNLGSDDEKMARQRSILGMTSPLHQNGKLSLSEGKVDRSRRSALAWCGSVFAAATLLEPMVANGSEFSESPISTGVIARSDLDVQGADPAGVIARSDLDVQGADPAGVIARSDLDVQGADPVVNSPPLSDVSEPPLELRPDVPSAADLTNSPTLAFLDDTPKILQDDDKSYKNGVDLAISVVDSPTLADPSDTVGKLPKSNVQSYEHSGIKPDKPSSVSMESSPAEEPKQSQGVLSSMLPPMLGLGTTILGVASLLSQKPSLDPDTPDVQLILVQPEPYGLDKGRNFYNGVYVRSIEEYCEAGKVNEDCTESINSYLESVSSGGVEPSDDTSGTIISYVDSLSNEPASATGAAFSSYLKELSSGSVPAPQSAQAVAGYLGSLGDASTNEYHVNTNVYNANGYQVDTNTNGYQVDTNTNGYQVDTNMNGYNVDTNGYNVNTNGYNVEQGVEAQGEDKDTRLSSIESRVNNIESSLDSLPERISSQLIQMQAQQNDKMSDDILKIVSHLVP